MSQPAPAPLSVGVADLRIGELLAEGGEGQVYQLPRQPHLVYKAYRASSDRGRLADLVAWPGRLGPAEAAVVGAASAWPCSVVVDGSGEAVGLLVPRAPRRFALRHRDGHSRLASLSYLTADPEHRAAAYGLDLPPPAAPERVGLVYALARLLSVFETADPAVGHGDLSTKNVLWSLQRGPEVFVIDCDNSERFGPDGNPVEAGTRRRPMTPNWDDPAVGRGANPGPGTDRYSLALVFLRVVGAANFPIQGRQRRGEPVEVRFPVPDRSPASVLMDPEHPLWKLGAGSLSVADAGARPPASAWLAPLEALLAAMGAPEVVDQVRQAQGGVIAAGAASLREGPEPARMVPAAASPPEGGPSADVSILPVAAPARPRSGERRAPPATSGGPPRAAIGYRSGPPGWRPTTGTAAPTWVRPTGVRAMAPGSVDPPAPVFPAAWAELRTQVRRFGRWWRELHRAALRRRGPRRASRRWRAAAACLVVDLALVVISGAVAAVIVSPLIQH
ncbi:MAG: hypothetical protein KGQ66_12005 [Acidobacteriota bacterium]|nr:hypothetical protein [Acidobacteriota bacterium]